MSDLLAELHARALIDRVSEKGDLAAHLASGARALYCGFDPTADSLHIGHLTPLLALFRFAARGHRPILLLGGATALIGDPSGKRAERRLRAPEEIAAWCDAIARQCDGLRGHFAERGLEVEALRVMNNLDWLGGVELLPFLRDVGRHFPVGMMTAKESVRARLDDADSGLSFTEFSYMLLQANDYAVLHERHQCTLQIGGSDQWGNMTSGLELIRRKAAGGDAEAYALTLPLLTRADGAKFGKSEDGAVWLSPERTSPYRFHQYWLNVPDADAAALANRLSFAIAPRPVGEGGDMRELKRELAAELTELVHGADGRRSAERIAQALFSAAAEELTEDDFRQLELDGLECTTLSEADASLVSALVASGLAKTPRGEVTAGQAKKFLRAGAIEVDGRKVEDETAALTRSAARFGRYHLLRRGKKQFHLLRWE